MYAGSILHFKGKHILCGLSFLITKIVYVELLTNIRGEDFDI